MDSFLRSQAQGINQQTQQNNGQYQQTQQPSTQYRPQGQPGIQNQGYQQPLYNQSQGYPTQPGFSQQGYTPTGFVQQPGVAPSGYNQPAYNATQSLSPTPNQAFNSAPNPNQGYNSFPNQGYNNSQFQEQPYTPQPIRQQYSAYPENNPQAQILANKSYQNHSFKGWNEPPEQQKYTQEANLILQGIENVESKIVQSITKILDLVKERSNKTRMVEDTDKRIEFLFERLNQGIGQVALSKTWLVVIELEKKDFNSARSMVVDLMTLADETKWVLGLKRLVELYAEIQ